MDIYHCTETGIRLGDGPEVSWQDLWDALARYFWPCSSVPMIREELEKALANGEVDGRVDLLKFALDTTCPRRALGIATSVHPSDIDPEGWAQAYNDLLQK